MSKYVSDNNLRLALQGTKKYIDNNVVIRPLPVYKTTEINESAIRHDVNIMDLHDGVLYGNFIDANDSRTQSYRIGYVCDNDTFKVVASMSASSLTTTICKAKKSSTYVELAYDNYIYKVDFTNHSTSTDVKVTKTLQKYLPINNTIEFNPDKDYDPTTKKYVDEKFYVMEAIEEVGVIPKSEMQNCNNGTSQYKSNINFDELFADHDKYAYYGVYKDDTLILIKYDSELNRFTTRKPLDISGTQNINLGFDLGTHRMYPFNGGAADVKAYQFTNDLVIKRVPILKQYVDDSLLITDTDSELIFEGLYNDSLILSDYENFAGYSAYLIDVQIDYDSTAMPYTVIVGENVNNIYYTFAPSDFIYDSTNNAWKAQAEDGDMLYFGKNSSGQLILTYNSMTPSFNYMKIMKSSEVQYTIKEYVDNNIVIADTDLNTAITDIFGVEYTIL